MIDQHAASRARNCIVAGALGDALSGTLKGSVGPQGALFPASPSLSDDTWLTLATCEAIAREGGRVHPARVAGVFVEWLAQKRFRGAGSASLTALRDLSAGADWAMSGARGELAAASAALARHLPNASRRASTSESTPVRMIFSAVAWKS